MQGIPLIRIFLRLGFTIPKQKFGSQDNVDKPSVACILHLHLLANGFIFDSFSLLFRVLLLLLICALSTTSYTTLSKKLALLLSCWRMITSRYSVLEKLAKYRQVTLFTCSLLPFSSIAIQPHPGFFGISSSTISVMISCRLTNIHPNFDFTQDKFYDYGLHLIDHVLHNWETQLSDIPGMPQIIGN